MKVDNLRTANIGILSLMKTNLLDSAFLLRPNIKNVESNDSVISLSLYSCVILAKSILF